MNKDIYDPAFVAGLFDRCSSRYRWWSAITSFGFIWLWRKQCVARLLGQSQVARIANGGVGPKIAAPQIVDLMAGTGEVWPHVLAAFPKANIVAIDISEQMHHEAVARLHATRSSRITHMQADALVADLPAESADMLIATFGLKTFNPQQQDILAKQIARVLRPGGCFALIEASDPRGWVFRPFYRTYMDRILPLVERVFLNGAQDFSMIGTYTRRFHDCSLIETALMANGLKATQQAHFFGCATSVAGTKPIAPSPTAT